MQIRTLCHVSPPLPATYNLTCQRRPKSHLPPVHILSCYHLRLPVPPLPEAQRGGHAFADETLAAVPRGPTTGVAFSSPSHSLRPNVPLRSCSATWICRTQVRADEANDCTVLRDLLSLRAAITVVEWHVHHDHRFVHQSVIRYACTLEVISHGT